MASWTGTGTGNGRKEKEKQLTRVSGVQRVERRKVENGAESAEKGKEKDGGREGGGGAVSCKAEAEGSQEETPTMYV